MKIRIRTFSLLAITLTLMSVSTNHSFSAVTTSGGSDLSKIARPSFHLGKTKNSNYTFLKAKSNGKLLTQKQIQSLSGSNSVHPLQNQSDDSIEVTHPFPGEWEWVKGYFGFFHTFDDGQTLFVTIIGEEAVLIDSDSYQVSWDKKVFWLDIGDGKPMHIAAQFEYAYEDFDTNRPLLAYYSSTFSFQDPNVNYDNTLFGEDFIDLWLYVDPETYEVVNYEIHIYDENGNLNGIRQLQPEDRVYPWTQGLDLDEPDTVWLVSMEGDYRTVQNPPQIYYKHLTPNYDFENELTDGVIDFSEIDLQLLLQGTAIPENSDFALIENSDVLPVNRKWGVSTSTAVPNWFIHWMD